MNQCERAQRKQKAKKGKHDTARQKLYNCAERGFEIGPRRYTDFVVSLCVCMCVVRTCMWTHTHVRAYMCRHYGRIVFVLISGSGECLQHSRRGTKQGVGEMRHRGVVNGWQKTASSKSNQKKTNWFCLRVSVSVRMCGCAAFIVLSL